MKNVALASSCKPEELYEIMACTGIVKNNKVKKVPLRETGELMQIDISTIMLWWLLAHPANIWSV